MKKLSVLLALCVFSLLVFACENNSPTIVNPENDSDRISLLKEGVVLGAQEITGEPHSALVASGFSCGIGSIGGFPFVLTTDSHTTISNSGNETLICRGNLPAGTEPAKAQVQTGFLCGTFSALTTNSKQIITPAGEITLKCQVP